jgi:hypothetical protein
MPALKINPILLAVVLAGASCAAQEAARTETGAHAIIWTDPGDIRSRNLYWGPGGDERQPKPPFEFIAEDLHGTNPKFDVRDSDGKKWHVKLGPEARPEVVASRLLWAVGYEANENYFVANLQVKNLPRLRRGQKLVQGDGNVANVRLQRRPHDEKKIGNWDWRHNRFYGTREFNGLRVMMALIRNWDLHDDNNAILEDTPGSQIYEVTDVGTSFGSAGKRYSSAESKGNPKEFRQGRLVSKIKGGYLDLNFPRMPPLLLHIFEVRFYFNQLGTKWIGKHIPRSDAKWIGSLLVQLTPDQIRDAFRAAGYSPETVEGFTTVLISRIQELNRL